MMAKMATKAGIMMNTAMDNSNSHITEMLIEGATMSITLNFHYVFDCVNAVGNSDTLLLELQGSMQPAIFKSYGKINYLYLLMPVRM